MRAALILLLLPASVFADAATPTAAVRGDWRANLAECGRRFERRFGGLRDGVFRDGAVKVMADADPPQVQFRLTTDRKQVMVAAVLAVDGSPRQEWERDDQWNYPIDPTIAWRERRALPDLEGTVIVYHDPHGDEAWRRTTFVQLAKLAVDDCMAASRWTAPEGTLTWQTDGFMFEETFRFDPSGATSLGRHTDGGAVGEMATVSGRETAPLFQLMRAHHLCGLAPSSAGPGARNTLTVEAAGLRCTVSLARDDWKDQPDAAPIRAAVEQLRDTLFPHRITGRMPI